LGKTKVLKIVPSNIPAQELEYVSDTSWSEVLEVWRQREEEVWRSHYEARGFKTWLEWRTFYTQKFAPEKRLWKLYSVIDPQVTIPKCYVGAYGGWKQYYPAETDVATFAAIALSNELPNNETVQKFLHNFPETRQMVAVRCGEQIVIRDGTHQCAATALAAKGGLPVTGRVIFALTDFAPTEAELFKQTFDQKFARQPASI
jgi:hypothetical protein